MIIVVKLKLFILTQFGGNRMLGVFWLTTDCNMKCIYCYEGNEKKKMYMNEETIDKAIEFLMTRAKELKDKRISNFMEVSHCSHIKVWKVLFTN